MPNMPFDSFPEEVDRIGWESFPPLVESLDDEESTQDVLHGEIAEACRSHRRSSSSSSSSSSSTSSTKKSVSFSTVNIREHQVIVGDHPCAAGSLPLSLGWAHATESRVIDIDTYEVIRSEHRRCLSDMQLTFLDRKNILKRVGGLTERDIIREQRRAFRGSFDDPALRMKMRRVQTVAAMAHLQAKDPYLPPAVVHAVAVNPGCPIKIEPRSSALTA